MLLRSTAARSSARVPSGGVFRLRYENVATCFHLFSMLQTAITTRIPGGRQPDAASSRSGVGQLSQKARPRSPWHYGRSLHPTPPVMLRVHLAQALVRSIPTVSVRRCSLWLPLLQLRSWTALPGPHLDALAADVVVEEQLLPENRQAGSRLLGYAQARDEPGGGPGEGQRTPTSRRPRRCLPVR